MGISILVFVLMFGLFLGGMGNWVDPNVPGERLALLFAVAMLGIYLPARISEVTQAYPPEREKYFYLLTPAFLRLLAGFALGPIVFVQEPLLAKIPLMVILGFMLVTLMCPQAPMTSGAFEDFPKTGTVSRIVAYCLPGYMIVSYQQLPTVGLSAVSLAIFLGVLVSIIILDILLDIRVRSAQQWP